MDQELDYLSLLGNIESRIGALVLMADSTEKAIEEIANREWFDPTKSRLYNKGTMKILGGAVMGYKGLYIELMILGLAKVIEDTINDLLYMFGINFNIWAENDPPIKHHEKAKVIRSLSNITKHNQGIIDKSNETPSIKYLTNNFDLPDGLFVRDLPYLPDSKIETDIIKNMYYIESFLFNLSSNKLNQKNYFEEVADKDIIDFMIKRHLSEIPGQK